MGDVLYSWSGKELNDPPERVVFSDWIDGLAAAEALDKMAEERLHVDKAGMVEYSAVEIVFLLLTQLADWFAEGAAFFCKSAAVVVCVVLSKDEHIVDVGSLVQVEIKCRLEAAQVPRANVHSVFLNVG